MLHAVNPTSTRVARVFGVLVVAAVCLFSAIEGVQAQAFQTPTDTLNVTGRSSWEQGYLGFLNLNRDLTGARPTAMGGAGLAIEGGVEYMSVNPAGLLGMRRWELTSEMAIVSGGGSVKSFPARLDVGAGQPLETQNYRVSPNFSSGYRNLSLGLPLVVFGKRGAAALAYRRMSPTFQAEETRFEVVGPITNNIPATTGVGGTPDGSHDAISIGLARNMADWLDLGLAINFQSGELSNLTEIGASVFGQRVTGGGTSFQQDISSFNVDLGSKMHFGKLTLGASAFLGHTLEFKNGSATVFPLPTIQDPNAPIFRINVATLDHEMTVPTSIGLGMSYELSSRLLVAADYWIRPWSKSEITRTSLEPFLFFTDEADSSTFGYLLTQGSGDETFNAGLDDANSVRLGLEWLMLQRDNFEMPVRLG
ncbi:MAG: hypothetical protein HKN21_14960, partial [Candidatus Eisenbacteria bacterium]|nr:hypothetical protein [Candidatus Eisenbacteria bacterium]